MRYHRIDGWRGYKIPDTAIVGVSYTGEWSDSPCRGADGDEEIERFRSEVLRPLKIRSSIREGETANVFCAKRWVCVGRSNFDRAVPLTLAWLKKNEDTTKLIHDADLKEKTNENNDRVA